MSKLLNAIEEAMKLMDKVEEWEAGDSDYVVCKDGVVIISLDYDDYDENDELKLTVNVIAGKPKITDIELGLLEE